MARNKRNSILTHFEARERQRELEGDKFSNLVSGMAEKTGVKYLEEKYGIEFATESSEVHNPATINPERPRTKQLAYLRESQTLIVQYRDDTLVSYEGIPPEMWQDLQTTDSTGRYIDGSGIYSMPYTKVNKFQLPQEIRVLFS
jgi:hypothetical protein